MNIFDKANGYIRDTEASVVNLLSAIAPWGAPLAPAFMSYGGMVNKLNFPVWVAVIIAGVIEILGLATVHTTIVFWQHNRRYKADMRKMPTALAGSMFALYLVVILTVNVLMEAFISWPGMPIVARALLSLLTVPAAITMVIRTQHTELLHEIESDKEMRRTMRASITHDAPVIRALPTHVCVVCGEVCANQQALAAHMRWQHAKVSNNGKVHEVVKE